jgi:hypothetical protein
MAEGPANQSPEQARLIATVLKYSGLVMIIVGVVVGQLQGRSDPQRGWLLAILFVAVGALDLFLSRVFRARAAKQAQGEQAGTRGTPTA